MGALTAHICLIALLVWTTRHHYKMGNQTGDLPQEVEVTFDTPNQGMMQGPQNKEQGGAKTSGAPSDQSASKSDSAENNDDIPRHDQGSTAPQLIAPETPDISGDMASNPRTQSSIPTDAKQPGPPQQPRHARQKRHSSNPFENMVNLDTGETSPTPRSHRGRYGGAHGPIDMSYGPLVKNGTVNAPNLSVRKIRGVSEDYGEELSNWIRSHLFYPQDAIANGEEGASSLHVVLDRQGHVKSVRVTEQSGSYSLDAAAMSIFSMHAKLPPIPPDMTGDHFDIDLTIDYILIRG